MKQDSSRRRFLQSSSAALLGVHSGALPALLCAAQSAEAAPKSNSPNEELVFGYVGTGIRYHNYLADSSLSFGRGAAVCDVDSIQVGRGVQRIVDHSLRNDRPINIATYEDYRHLLDRKDIDAVVIGTTDHWHTKIAIEAMQAGKDVYCEKPLTLTIREGQQILQAIKQTGRVLAVGSQQRTEFERRFAIAAAMVRDGRIGAPKRVTCALGTFETCPVLPVVTPPKNLNWEMWLGQAPWTEYRKGTLIHTKGWGAGFPRSRTHRYFRWWYEYSGGRLTDWGAHHVDIALWALDRAHANVGKMRIDPLHVEHPVPLDANGMPTQDDRFNTATAFHVRVTFEDGVELDIRDDAKDLGFGNGVMFQGDAGKFFVNRGKLTGKPVEQLAQNPLPEDALLRLYGRKVAPTHMGDFVECIKSRKTPASDAESHHRSISVCHVVNIALRLGRALTYDTKTEQFLDDPQANSMIEREQRKGYEIVV